MSFLQVVTSNSHLADTVAQLKEALKTPTYSPNPNQVFDNLDRDPLVAALPATPPGGSSTRLDLLNHVQTSTVPAMEAVTSFCRANMLQGPEVSVTALGRVQTLKGLRNALTTPTTATPPAFVSELVADLTARTPSLSSALANQKLNLFGIRLSRYVMWSFPVADPSAPYRTIHGAGGTRHDAINILGLGCLTDPADQLVRWTHALPGGMVARQPAVWDSNTGGANPHWRPGGNTFSLDGTGHGIPEVVHDPIRGEDLIAPIEALG